MGFPVTGTVDLPDNGAQTPKHVADMHQMYVYSRRRAFKLVLKTCLMTNDEAHYYVIFSAILLTSVILYNQL